MTTPESTPALNFIEEIIEEHNRTGRFGGPRADALPPEPNGYSAHRPRQVDLPQLRHWPVKYGGKCNLRFDDTNPTKEEQRIRRFDHARTSAGSASTGTDREFYASDYFEQLYDWAVQLIKTGKAYVCDLTAEEMREASRRPDQARQGQPVPQPLRRGEPRSVPPHEGRRVPRRARGRCGPRSTWPRRTSTCATRSCTASCTPSITAPATSGASTRCTTGPTASRIRSRASRIRSARWSSRTIGRSTTGTSRSIGIYHPQQIEFARLNLTYTVMSKRKLLQLVQEKHVTRLGRSAHADDLRHAPPRLHARGDPQVLRAHRRRRSSTASSTCRWLEDALREDLNKQAPRVMAVLQPLKVVIDNYPEGQTEELEAVNNPEDPAAGTRKVPFSRVLYIEQDDFREDPPKNFFRLAPGREVRLRYAYFIKCIERRQGPGDRRGHRAALHLRPGHARRQRAGRPQGQGDDPLGLGRSTPSMPRCGCTTICSPSPTPTTCRKARTTRRT